MFAAAEPHDVTIVCGEFDTGVQILENSAEPEQVFQVEKIINHPHYQPNRVSIWINSQSWSLFRLGLFNFSRME